MPTERRPRGCTMRLCNRGRSPNTARMKRFLKALGISGARYLQWTGAQPLNAFRAANPNWTGRAWEVLVWENRDLLGGDPQEKAHHRAVSDRRYAKKSVLSPAQGELGL